uniref:Uncharacterized protein n=1 Tax=Rhizophora mucronata TaxID=61149 RepID=A0A2P2IRE3_RHIMU
MLVPREKYIIFQLLESTFVSITRAPICMLVPRAGNLTYFMRT